MERFDQMEWREHNNGLDQSYGDDRQACISCAFAPSARRPCVWKRLDGILCTISYISISSLKLQVPGCTWLYFAVPGCIWLYLAELGCTRLYMAELDCTWLYLALFGCTWLYQTVLGCTWLYLFEFGCTWLNLAELDCTLLFLALPGCTWLYLAELGCLEQFWTLKPTCLWMDGWMDWMGYLQTGPFLDHLAVKIRSWKKNTFDMNNRSIDWPQKSESSWLSCGISVYCKITVIATFCCWEW